MFVSSSDSYKHHISCSFILFTTRFWCMFWHLSCHALNIALLCLPVDDKWIGTTEKKVNEQPKVPLPYIQRQCSTIIDESTNRLCQRNTRTNNKDKQTEKNAFPILSLSYYARNCIYHFVVCSVRTAVWKSREFFNNRIFRRTLCVVAYCIYVCWNKRLFTCQNSRYALFKCVSASLQFANARNSRRGLST